ncbi:flagellar hook protein FlgE [Laribacter hongkongensis]|uniref:flagellar hook protein FlgE n=1 Tax=Laribacter hongkongensis TaxID=168471 RepID=UPI001EFD4896|nr:flagellar hook protein FlgE [Laribacter hongkongensis]MCG8991527.1 flagellar hook protein FlgE [Laribacter hongkongensis]MCG8996780.1 flagellar hook protein FlgE [Laribacter hongkongensis]MCG9001191.1 flagellar hook protein FlgE [Laribacter hongkongensis]MCG9003113.1 flagellar hook protein FlgE [Laribacter hongkongensis]MCG9007399.1 flagellar hook protein FlgE [Laribacter hongkongensis]
MAFQHGLSGINAASKQLDAIGNNVANSSTVGFKGSRAEFADMFAANFYGVAATQNGIGVNTTLIAQQFGQGNITTTGNQLDLAISGNGFFVMQNANGISYTRNGQFQIDREGFINNNGDYLMGWQVDDRTTPPSVQNGNLGPLKIDNSLLEPRPSDYGGESMRFNINLDSRNNPVEYNALTEGASLTGVTALPVPPATAAFNAADKIKMSDGSYVLASGANLGQKFNSDGSPINDAGGNPTFYDKKLGWLDAAGAVQQYTPNAANPTTTAGTIAAVSIAFNPSDPATYNSKTALTAYDSLGNPIQVAVYFKKTADGQWDVYATAKHTDGSVVDLGTGNAAASPYTALGTGLAFGPDGKLTNGGPIAAATYTPAGGGAPLALKFDFSGSTQFGTSFAVNELVQPGYASAVVSNLQIDKTGIVSARYSNGQTKVIGQVVLANFANQQGLQPIGNNRWMETYNSGNPTLNDPGSTNVGLIQSQALEDSNVDLTGELVNMITAQRYYQANAQTIKVHDQVLQSLMQMR